MLVFVYFISDVKVYINGVGDVTSTELRLYTDTNTLVYSEAWTPVEGWQTVHLTTPYPITATDLFVGYNLIATGGYPAGCDGAATPDPNGNWMYFGSWTHLIDLAPTLTGMWSIRTMVDDGVLPPNPVATCAPLAWDAGAILTGTGTTSGTFTLSNIGSGTLTVTSATDLTGTMFSTTFAAGAVSLGTGVTYDFTFDFDPTADGTYNEAFQIVTNGGTIDITLDGIGNPPCGLITTFPFNEGFEGGVVPPNCWEMVDNDGDGNNWEVRDTSGWPGHTGAYMAVSASWQGSAFTPDNFLITPQLEITSADFMLNFWTAAQDPAYAADYYAVLVSTTGTAVGDFTEIYNETIASEVWDEKNLSLAAYNGQNIYIAWRHHNCTDMYYMKLDDVEVAEAVNVNEINVSNILLYPNPTTGIVNISNAANANVSVYNMLGEVVVNVANFDNALDLSSLSKGTYVVKVQTENNVVTEKVTIK